MSYRTFSPYSTPARQPSGWPVYMQSPPQNHLNSHTNKTIGSNHNTFQTPKSIAMPVPKLAEQKAPVPSMTPAHQVQVHRWIPPTRPESPDEFPWRTPIFSEGDSASTASTSSSDDDESPAETSQPLAPKPTLSSANLQDKKPLDGGLFESSLAISNLSTILTPMANQQGGMQLLALRSPSVRVDKVIHGAFSPATTVHIVLPYSPSARPRPTSKPPLPLPSSSSAKAVPRPQRATIQPQPATTNSILSPPVIGLDLALLPPSDHRDSAMAIRNSMGPVKPRSHRPSLVTPVDVPSRTSTFTNSSGRHLWKPSSAPTPPSPISVGHPESSTIPMPLIRIRPQEDVPPPLPPKDLPRRNTPDLTQRTASVTSFDSAEIRAPAQALAPAPKPSPLTRPISAIDDRAEIMRRTLSSNNLRQRTPEPEPETQAPKRESTPVMEIPEIVVEPPVPSALDSMLQMITRPAPTPLQPPVMFPLDDPDFDEPPAPLRVINVTSEFGVDSMATVPISEPLVIENPSRSSLDTPVSTASTDSSSTLPVATEFPTSSNHGHSNVSEQSNRIEGFSVGEPSRTNEPKHRSLPVASRSGSAGQLGPSTVHLPRITLTDRPVPRFSSGTDLPFHAPPKLPLPNTKSWHPRRLTVPTPLSQTPIQANPRLPQAAVQKQKQQQPVRKPQPQPQPQPAVQQQHAFPRFRHSHSRSDSLPPSTLARVDKEFEPPQPAFAAPVDYYSSDDDDPSKWAPYPEAPSSRRSSRASRSFSAHRNSIYGFRAESDDEDNGACYPPLPSISLPNLRPILQYPGEDEPITPGERRVKFAIPDGVDKPSRAAAPNKRKSYRKRSNSTDSVIRGPEEIPWLQDSDVPRRRSGMMTYPDPFGHKWADEGRYDAINAPELIPADIQKRYIRDDGAPKFPEYREVSEPSPPSSSSSTTKTQQRTSQNFTAKTNAQRVAAEAESRARILGRKQRTPAVSIEIEEDLAITVPVCLRRPRAISEGGAKLRRPSRSRDRADWAPPPTIPDPEIPAYPTMPPQSTSIFPNPFEKVSRRLTKFRR
ncbi:hypothetical protein FRC14_002763 [Serendipita sp. 396]|nr:hypothetical protein FRC14_002763 [Serendipita sp. 396]KAG8803985.1 hypothetical protein FRC16_001702 [Serendipita sp. 398]KAG8876308.1 hypothetical protein FRC20_001811 [Serendipita sp. 405]